eukprot:CAMPEP_0116153136 /NCGR_PEP_ID=MMETSP0329-20121206/21059_1 /TAXON_ID=697910 /ORGANISM="Pseudo-nitzschia arenysensis, Strain B593" /LENGTH=723 /DNA_ID=CAMNT_0003649975 /DNA_START=58 /DNA_END=2229 /DNA_ORIENTATION=+
MSAPPPSAFGGSRGPPPSAFASNGAAPEQNNAPSADLSSRWKQYEAEKKSTPKMVGPDGPDYDLYETPEKQRKPSAGLSAAAPRQLYNNEEHEEQPEQQPRRSYSLTKSSSYNTDDLIAKYSGSAGAPSANPSLRRTASNTSSSAIPSAARAEAVKVLSMADDQLSKNQPFSVRRTESGGFRASAAPDQDFSFQRSASNSRRTPSALSGLGLNKTLSTERVDWKSNRYAFSDPKFRDDDYLAEEEDDIVGPADPEYEKPYSDKKAGVFDSVGFDGDFPRKIKSSWSSRYTDNPNAVLDRFDKSHQQPTSVPDRKNVLMGAASNVGSKMRGLSDRVTSKVRTAKNDTGVFKKGFSFKDNVKTSRDSMPAATGLTNLRTVWKDDEFHDEGDDMGIGGGDKHHKTWEQVAAQKKRRRKILCSVLCLAITFTAIFVSISQTSWRWKYKNLWRNGNVHMDVTFYVTSNTPMGYGSTEQQISTDLANIPSDAEFVAHLGNLQDASTGMCPASRMPEVASLMQRSPVPVYVVPGEQDWIKCPDQMTAFARWLDAFSTHNAFETAVGTTTAASAGEFDRPKTTPDIFSKLHHGVLFFGLHLVSGHVTEGAEIQSFRDEKMEIFVRGTLERLKGEYRSVVMLGNARPGPQQQRFFDSLRDDLKNARVPVAYVHSHSGFGETEHYPFGQKKSKKDVLSGMVAIQAASGEANQAPLKITVGFGKDPFTVGNDVE